MFTRKRRRVDWNQIQNLAVLWTLLPLYSCDRTTHHSPVFFLQSAANSAFTL
jgi:hypothetical protein